MAKPREGIEIAIQGIDGKQRRKSVDGKIFGAWAAHGAYSGFGYRVTFIRFGLAVPYDFDNMQGACAAAKKINALCNDWDALTGSAIKSKYGGTIKSMCAKYAGVVKRPERKGRSRRPAPRRRRRVTPSPSAKGRASASVLTRGTEHAENPHRKLRSGRLHHDSLCAVPGIPHGACRMGGKPCPRPTRLHVMA